MALSKEKMTEAEPLVARSLTHAIAALRTRSWAMHQPDKALLFQARRDVEVQQSYVAQVQQALMGNTESKTIANVTPHWVNKRLKKISSGDADNGGMTNSVVTMPVVSHCDKSMGSKGDYQYLRRL